MREEGKEQKVHVPRNQELRQRIDAATREILWRRRDLELHVRRIQRRRDRELGL